MVAVLAVLGCVGGVANVVDAPGVPTADTAPAAPLALQFDGPAPTNVLMLSIDTLRADRATPELMPFLTGLRAEGFVLQDVTACSNWTVPTTACVLSGATDLDRAPDRGMVPILLGEPMARIPQEAMLPTWLGEAGFQSVLVTANSYFSRTWGNAQGYGAVEVVTAENLSAVWARAQGLADPAGEPWLLHLHSMEPHRPYLAPEALVDVAGLPPIPFDLGTVAGQEAADQAIAADPPVLSADEIRAVQEHMRARYDAEVRFADQGLQEVWGELEAGGWLDDTLVVIWSDHGEELWDHGPPGHAYLLHQAERRAVAMFWAKNLEAGAWLPPVETRDLAPTVLAALGLPIPATVTGTPVGRAPADRPMFSLVDGFAGPVQSVRRGDWLLHFRWHGASTGSPTVGLYDVGVDPGEEVDLFDAAAPRAEALELWELLVDEIVAAQPYIAADPRGGEVEWPPGLPAGP